MDSKSILEITPLGSVHVWRLISRLTILDGCCAACIRKGWRSEVNQIRLRDGRFGALGADVGSCCPWLREYGFTLLGTIFPPFFVFIGVLCSQPPQAERNMQSRTIAEPSRAAECHPPNLDMHIRGRRDDGVSGQMEVKVQVA